MRKTKPEHEEKEQWDGRFTERLLHILNRMAVSLEGIEVNTRPVPSKNTVLVPDKLKGVTAP